MYGWGRGAVASCKTKRTHRQQGGRGVQDSLEVDSAVLVEIKLLEDPVRHVHKLLGEVELLHHGGHVLSFLLTHMHAEAVHRMGDCYFRRGASRSTGAILHTNTHMDT